MPRPARRIAALEVLAGRGDGVVVRNAAAETLTRDRDPAVLEVALVLAYQLSGNRCRSVVYPAMRPGFQPRGGTNVTIWPSGVTVARPGRGGGTLRPLM